ncbi:hypothetical protein [Sporosarcina sp. FSL K6-3457]|uniref:hypothetical protein n=1 Tax=Sporosarcina sp. FSL K6-3457 TaxID=2978204 RepID=UPI0030F5D9BF
MGQIEREFVSPTMEAILTGAQEIGEKRGIEKGIEKGRKEGREEGEKIGVKMGAEKSLTKVALEMLKKDFPIDVIAEVTHLDIEAIKKLKETI